LHRLTRFGFTHFFLGEIATAAITKKRLLDNREVRWGLEIRELLLLGLGLRDGSVLFSSVFCE
jgi:hypothetical protein